MVPQAFCWSFTFSFRHWFILLIFSLTMLLGIFRGTSFCLLSRFIPAHQSFRLEKVPKELPTSVMSTYDKHMYNKLDFVRYKGSILAPSSSILRSF